MKYGYWIASPAARQSDRIYHEFYRGYIYDDAGSGKYTLRPVICLNSNAALNLIEVD